MTDFTTSAHITRRTEAAVDAAVGAGRDLGLTITDATVLHELFSVVVHLAPAPVVARVPVVLPDSTDPGAQTRGMQAELDVTQWLADQGAPVVPPSALVPREPVLRDGFAMTFWQLVEEDHNAEPDYVANAEFTADLHFAMRAYPGRLSFLSSAEPGWVTHSLRRLEEHPDLLEAEHLERARGQWRVLEPLVRSREAFEEAFPGVGLQPVHGDCPPVNVFPGVERDLHSDFELVTLGPVEWDLAALGPKHRAAYDRGAKRHGIRTLNEDVVDFVNAVGMLRAVASLMFVPQLPVLVEYLRPSVEHWAATPFAGVPAG